MSHCCCRNTDSYQFEAAAAIAEDMAELLDAGEPITVAGRHAVALAEQRED